MSESPKESGGSGEKQKLFPPTRWTLVLRTLDSEEEHDALSELCRIYWSPVYFFLRSRGNSPSDAEDLTQGFFQQVLAKEQLQQAAKNTGAGKLRTFLLTSLRNYTINQYHHETAQKRGGGFERVHVDPDELERRFSSASASGKTPDEMFDLQWANSLLERTFERLRKEYADAEKEKDFEVLRSTLGQSSEQVPFSVLASQLDRSEGSIRVAAFRLRKQFRALLKDEIRESSASEDDWEEELAYLKSILGG